MMFMRRLVVSGAHKLDAPAAAMLSYNATATAMLCPPIYPPATGRAIQSINGTKPGLAYSALHHDGASFGGLQKWPPQHTSDHLATSSK